MTLFEHVNVNLFSASPHASFRSSSSGNIRSFRSEISVHQPLAFGFSLFAVLQLILCFPEGGGCCVCVGRGGAGGRE